MTMVINHLLYTRDPETNGSHLKISHPKRKLVFQPSIFRCENVSFRDGRVLKGGGVQGGHES